MNWIIKREKGKREERRVQDNVINMYKSIKQCNVINAYDASIDIALKNPDHHQKR